jgi:hypothetical protein
VAQFSLSALKLLHTILSDDDQGHIYHSSSKALAAAKRRGETRLIDYWSGRPVVTIELLQYVIVRDPCIVLVTWLLQASVGKTISGELHLYPYSTKVSGCGQTATNDEPIPV